ncbi:MAG: oligosaccharide flippase family protein [Nanoarchaeota archaeon]
MESIKSHAVKNSLWDFLMKFFSKIGALIFTILIARFLLPEDFGVFNLVLSITLMLLMFADLGINQALALYVSEALKNSKKSLAIARYKYLLKLKLILSLVLSIGLLLVSYPLAFFVYKDKALLFPLIFSSFYLLVYSLESFYESIFYVFGKVKLLTVKQLMWEFIRIIGVLLVFTYFMRQYYTSGVFVVLSISMLFALLFLLYYSFKIAPFLFEKQKIGADKERINKFLFYFIFASAFSVIFGYVDIIMIGFYISEKKFAGFYAAAMTIAEGLGVLLSIAPILIPMFVKLKKEKLPQAFEKVLQYTLLISIPLLAGLIILGGYIVQTVYGYEYLPALLPLYVLSFLIFEVPISNSFRALLAAKEKSRYLLNLLIIASLSNVILNAILIKYLLGFSEIWAITGAAIATITSRSVYMIGLYIYSKRKFDIKLNKIHIIKPIFGAIIMSMILYAINLHFKDMNLLLGISEVIFGALVYFTVMFAIKGIKKEDCLLIKYFFQKN